MKIINSINTKQLVEVKYMYIEGEVNKWSQKTCLPTMEIQTDKYCMTPGFLFNKGSSLFTPAI